MDNNFDSKQSDNFDETKRKSLIKMGKRAVYVTPVVLTLLTSHNATAGSHLASFSPAPKPKKPKNKPSLCFIGSKE